MKNIIRQKGVALITALMIVAIASVISAKISTSIQLDIRRTGNIIASDQAKLYVLTAEEVAKRYLLEDLKDNKIDDLNEAWAQPYIFPLEDGTLTAILSDLQSCINLNSLVTNNTINTVAKNRFEQLLTRANLLPLLSQTIIDWIDTDLNTTIPDGAEDNYYTGLESPYRSANTSIRSISELKLIKGFEDPKTIAAIENSICAFGESSAPVSINVNTAPAEVLLSLSSGLSLTDAECIIEQRADTPFTNPANFMSFCGLTTILPAIKTDQLSENTNYFMLETNVKIGTTSITMFSIINRATSSNINVISRSLGVY